MWNVVNLLESLMWLILGPFCIGTCGLRPICHTVLLLAGMHVTRSLALGYWVLCSLLLWEFYFSGQDKESLCRWYLTFCTEICWHTKTTKRDSSNGKYAACPHNIGYLLSFCHCSFQIWYNWEIDLIVVMIMGCVLQNSNQKHLVSEFPTDLSVFVML